MDTYGYNALPTLKDVVEVEVERLCQDRLIGEIDQQEFTQALLGLGFNEQEIVEIDCGRMEG